ncbi:MAG: DbpA RNA binding domain-containing protein, partial [Alphaproteobacteria bacterium]
LVIHADLPNDAEVLQHRSGRTGRAGRKGVSVLLVPPARRRRAEEMLGRARVQAVWGVAPSAAEIRKLDQERLLQNALLLEPASEDDLAMADALLQQKGPREIAAAFVKIYRSQLPPPEELEDDGAPTEHAPREHKPRAQGDTGRGERPAHKQHGHQGEKRHGEKRHVQEPHGRPAQRSGAPGSTPRAMENGVWFRLNVGRGRNADPKWLLPEICRQGELTKKDIGAIRVFEMETLFQVAPEAAPKFTILVSERKKGGVRISPALDQTGETTAHAREVRDDRPREKIAHGAAPGDTPPHKPGFKKKFGKPGGGYKGKNPRPKPQA